jgi:hypothetical protein
MLNAALFIIVLFLCLLNLIYLIPIIATSIQPTQGKGKKKKESIKAAQAKTNPSDKKAIKEVDYTLPPNYAVDFFCSHKVSKKKTVGPMSLKQGGKCSQKERTPGSLFYTKLRIIQHCLRST